MRDTRGLHEPPDCTCTQPRARLAGVRTWGVSSVMTNHQVPNPHFTRETEMQAEDGKTVYANRTLTHSLQQPAPEINPFSVLTSQETNPFSALTSQTTNLFFALTSQTTNPFFAPTSQEAAALSQAVLCRKSDNYL